MTFDQDPGEQARISASDLAQMCDEMRRLQHRNAEQLSRLEEISKQHLAAEMDDFTREHADWEGGYEAIVMIARAAIAKEGKEGA